MIIRISKKIVFASQPLVSETRPGPVRLTGGTILQAPLARDGYY